MQQFSRALPAGAQMPERMRFGLAIGILVISIVIAARVGLIELIGKGYSASAYVVLAIYIIPLVTLDVWRMRRAGPEESDIVAVDGAV